MTQPCCGCDAGHGKGFGIARVVQHAERPPVRSRRPYDLALALAGAQAAGNSSQSRLNVCTTTRVELVRAKLSSR